MADSQQNQLIVSQPEDVIYDNCDPDMKIEGEKLRSIIGYAINAMGVSVSGNDAEDLYDNYCAGFNKKLNASEPYHISVEMKELKREIIVNDMKELLPQRVEKFDKLIEKTADRAVAVLDFSTNKPGLVICRKSKQEFVASEFSVLKIFKSGENLEIIPCYMSVRGKKAGKKVLFLASWEETEAIMTYKQTKFILTKFDITAIIKKLSKDAEERW
jgi:hypothetical protein